MEEEQIKKQMAALKTMIEETPIEYVKDFKARHLRERRTRLIEQYAGEMLKPTLKTDGYEKAYIAFPDVDEVVSIAKYAADAVIKATEER